jgi:DNA-binding beta-propeller fold protein YncE
MTPLDTLCSARHARRAPPSALARARCELDMLRRGSLSATILVVALAMSAPGIGRGSAAAGADAPVFEVDPFWPRPLPAGWLMGQAAGVAARGDRVWVLQRPRSLTEDERGALTTPPRSLCCKPAPPVMEFDAAGRLVTAWGGPGHGHPWPDSEHGIHVDDREHVWIAGNGARDGLVLKFTRDGKFLMKIGEPGVIGDDRDTRHLNRPAAMVVDPTTRELFVADGYGNHRVIVFDADTGAYRRHWGANGRPPGDPGVTPWKTPVHCVRLSRDGLLYVCDRANNRLQVFRKDGTYVRELVVAPGTRGNGSTWDVDLSHDAAQVHLYTADGENNHVWLLLRESGRVLGTLGRRGRQAGQFHWVHNIAVDAAGNIYTTEVDTGKRAQKFVRKGTP